MRGNVTFGDAEIPSDSLPSLTDFAPDVTIHIRPALDASERIPDRRPAHSHHEFGMGRGHGQRYDDDYTKSRHRTSSGRLIFFGHEYFWKLKPTREENKTQYSVHSLMDHYPSDYLSARFVVCYSSGINPETHEKFYIRDPRKTTCKLFAVFETYVEFYTHCQNYRSEDLGFFEIILGQRPQKPHFDVDIDQETFDKVCCYQFDPDPLVNFDISASWIKDTLITCIGQELASKNVRCTLEENLLLFNSHSAVKRSFHIVLANLSHPNAREARAFFEAVMVRFRLVCPYPRFIDHRVYTSRQQFRIVFSQKYGSNRPKLFCPVFTHMGLTYHHTFIQPPARPELASLVLLRDSLVSFTAGCSQLPTWYVETNKYANRVTGVDSNLPVNMRQGDLEITETMRLRCMELMHAAMDDSMFEYVEVNENNQIILARRGESMCPKCKHTHSSNNPYMFIKGNKVFWNCRAAPDNKSLNIGLLNPDRDCYDRPILGVELKPEEAPEPIRPNRGFNFLPPPLPTIAPETMIQSEQDIPVVHSEPPPLTILATGLPSFARTSDYIIPLAAQPSRLLEETTDIVALQAYIVERDARESYRHYPPNN